MYNLPPLTDSERDAIEAFCNNYDAIAYLWRTFVRPAAPKWRLSAPQLWNLKQQAISDGGDGTVVPLLAGPFAEAVNAALADAPPYNWGTAIYQLYKRNDELLPVFDAQGNPLIYADTEQNPYCSDCASVHTGWHPICERLPLENGDIERCTECGELVFIRPPVT